MEGSPTEQRTVGLTYLIEKDLGAALAAGPSGREVRRALRAYRPSKEFVMLVSHPNGSVSLFVVRPDVAPPPAALQENPRTHD